MNEGRMRNRMDNGPHNLAVLRHMALDLVRKESSKGSLPKKLRRAAWSDAFLARVLAQICNGLPCLHYSGFRLSRQKVSA